MISDIHIMQYVRESKDRLSNRLGVYIGQIHDFHIRGPDICPVWVVWDGPKRTITGRFFVDNEKYHYDLEINLNFDENIVPSFNNYECVRGPLNFVTNPLQRNNIGTSISKNIEKIDENMSSIKNYIDNVFFIIENKIKNDNILDNIKNDNKKQIKIKNYKKNKNKINYKDTIVAHLFGPVGGALNWSVTHKYIDVSFKPRKGSNIYRNGEELRYNNIDLDTNEDFTFMRFSINLGSMEIDSYEEYFDRPDNIENQVYFFEKIIELFT
jgi:hypothetical protein